MRRITGSLHMKSVITLENYENVFKLATLAGDTKDEKEQGLYLEKMICELTTMKGRFKKKYFKYTNDILKHAGLLSKSTETSDEIREEYKRFCSFIAVRLNKTSLEFMRSSTAETLERDSREVIRRDLLLAESLMKAYHMPSEYFKEISERLKELKSKAQIESEKKKIIKNRAPLMIVPFKRQPV